MIQWKQVGFLDGCRLLFFLWLLIKFSVMSPRGMLITLAPYLQGGLVSKVYIYTWTAGIYLYQGEENEGNVFRKCSADICMSCTLAYNELRVPYYYIFLWTLPALSWPHIKPDGVVIISFNTREYVASATLTYIVEVLSLLNRIMMLYEAVMVILLYASVWWCHYMQNTFNSN